MSHSDSELKTDFKIKIRKQLQIDFKASKRIHNQHDIRMLKKKIHPLCQEMRFLQAVNTHNTNEVKRFLDQGVSPNTSDSQLRSALHLAVTKEYADIVQLLLLYGADPNKRDLIYNTPLHLAACIHNLPIITMLINAKANVNLKDTCGRKPLDLAKSKLEILLRSFRNGSIEMIRLKRELEQIVDLLLSILNRSVEREQNDNNIFEAAQLHLMKLSISTETNSNLDNAMTKLLGDIENMKI
ncbi:hypothetical protein ABEB36_000795 [Hypothenemus hampei]|uniref:Ankyrin repeat domain-containing protein 54 n=1 Tax=Hypothenemus hampei TaxID=57062 RepID=A0ABD1FCI7_HYPHA